MSGSESFLPRSRALDSLPSYPLADLPARKRELTQRGIEVIDLGAGDARLPPPDPAVSRLRAVAGDPEFSRYGFQMGLPEFREEVARWMASRFGVTLDPYREIHPLIGSKEGITHLALGCLNPGDVAILPDPGFLAYLGGVVLSGAEPYLAPLRPESGFRVVFDELPEDVVKRARLLYLNYPNNPTTATVDVGYYREAVSFCRRNGIALIQDHAYSEIAFDGYRPPSVLEVKGAEEIAVEFHSLSKTYNMTGWRLGWIAGNPELVGRLARAKSFIDTGPYLAVQAGGVEALRSHGEWVPRNVAVFEARRNAGVDALREEGFEVSRPRATMYLWVRVPGEESSASFTRRALEEEGVVLFPGAGMGAGGEGFFRIALTVPEGRLAEAARRLGRLRRRA